MQFDEPHGRFGITPGNTKLSAVGSLRAMRRASARIATVREHVRFPPVALRSSALANQHLEQSVEPVPGHRLELEDL